MDFRVSIIPLYKSLLPIVTPSTSAFVLMRSPMFYNPLKHFLSTEAANHTILFTLLLGQEAHDFNQIIFMAAREICLNSTANALLTIHWITQMVTAFFKIELKRNIRFDK